MSCRVSFLAFPYFSHWTFANNIAEQQIELFYDRPDVPSTQTHSSSGGFYRTREAGNDDIALLRLKDGMDTTLPATNAVAASNLFRLGSILDDATYTHLARETIHAFEVEMLQHSWLFPGLLAQIVSARLGGPQVAAKTAGPSASDPVVVEYFQRPRAGLRSLVYVEGGAGNGKETAAASWLLGRNPSLVDLSTKEAAEASSSSYVLKDGKWEKASPADLVVNAEASG